MKRGDLRRFKDFGREWSLSKAYFVVVVENAAWEGWARRVDILLDGRVEAMDYFWVMNNSEVLNETG